MKKMTLAKEWLENRIITLKMDTEENKIKIDIKKESLKILEANQKYLLALIKELETVKVVKKL